MIKKHDFNSQWWGSVVGLVTDIEFFSLPKEKISDLLKDYSWVEFKHPINPSVPLHLIADTGFFQTDTQIPLRIGLTEIIPTTSLDNSEVVSAKSDPFVIDASDLKTFRHERFFFLPGADETKINKRYAIWANKLIDQYPDICLQISKDGKTGGWFLSSRSDSEIDFTLAMLHKNSEIPGKLLYSRALVEYSKKGFEVGTSAFSANNAAVMKIFLSLGARLLEPEACWLWINPRTLSD